MAVIMERQSGGEALAFDDVLLTPGYSTAVGLLQWGAGSIAAGEPLRYESAPAMGGLGRIRDALRSIFP